MAETKPGMCHCGRPLHFRSEEERLATERAIEREGEFARIQIDEDRAWWVPRTYLVLHGFTQRELPTLGFEEVKPKKIADLISETRNVVDLRQGMK